MTNAVIPPDQDEWSVARCVWSAAGVDLPDLPTDADQFYLTRLKHVAATFRAAKSATETDRTRAWTHTEIAERCRNLSDVLGEMDDIAFARIAGASPVAADQLLAETKSNLYLLEAALRNARQPDIPRRKTHEHNDFLVILLAREYERVVGRPPSVTTDPITNERGGPFVSFVQVFAQNFLPDHTPIPNGRAVQRALKARRDTPDPLADTKIRPA